MVVLEFYKWALNTILDVILIIVNFFVQNGKLLESKASVYVRAVAIVVIPFIADPGLYVFLLPFALLYGARFLPAAATTLRGRLEIQFSFKVKPKDEIDIKIKEIYLYPIRGIKGIKVDSIELTNGGIKNDRNWLIHSVKKKKHICSGGNAIVTFLRVTIDPKDENKLTIAFQDSKCFKEIKKRSHVLRFDQKYEEKDWINVGKNYFG